MTVLSRRSLSDADIVPTGSVGRDGSTRTSDVVVNARGRPSVISVVVVLAGTSSAPTVLSPSVVVPPHAVAQNVSATPTTADRNTLCRIILPPRQVAPLGARGTW